MRSKNTYFFKIVMIFSISPGFSGIILLTTSLPPDFSKIIQAPLHFIRSFFEVIILGFFGGLLFYITPAFILGLIYATMKLTISWKSYIFVILFSPAFIFISNELLMKNTVIPGWIKVDQLALIALICPLSSAASFIAAWLSFPKPQNLIKNRESINNKSLKDK